MKHIKLFEAFKDKKPKKDKIELDLSGEHGNAYVVIALATNLANQLDYTKDEIDKMKSLMMSRDYDFLINVFEDNFGDYVDIYGYKSSEDKEDDE
ncbi:hypothetical protein M0Q50_03725 [bacterium]|jgi:hypothetical protein|nr:hypothetical protein [bacterium]